MPEKVSISVNGESRVPPGFRFHPTEEELLQYYLRKKVAFEKIDLDVIVEVDLNKLEPWDIQERCKIGSTPQNDWYFFSHKDKKYPTGTRTNRATTAGFWKATGRDKIIYGSGIRIGMRKTLVFYTGRAPHGQKSDWIMHEYRLNEIGANTTTTTNLPDSVVTMATIGCEMGQEEGWVVCRIFKKKYFQKSLGNELNSPISSTMSVSELTKSTTLTPTISDGQKGALDQIFQNTITKLPSLESATPDQGNYHLALNYEEPPPITGGGFSDWAVIDHLLASHLNQEHSQTNPIGNDRFAFSSFDHQDDDRHQPRLMMQIPRSSSFSSSTSSSSRNLVQPPAQDYYSTGELDLWSIITRTSLSSSTSNDAPI